MKIIYGRAGCGKSEFIFNKIKEELKQNKENCKIFIITPEQFSFTAEKRLLDTLDESATVNVEVLSFERMAYRVIKETINVDKTLIGKSEKSMIIYDAIAKHQKDLCFLGKSLENVDTIITQITEFKKHNITIEMLEKQVNEEENKYIKSKLNDMLIMYKELEDKIAINYIDENDLLTILYQNIEKSHLFDKAIFYLDEFAGFTKQEYSVIQELDKIAKEIYITVCTDGLNISKSPEADVFYDNKQNIQTLCEIGKIDKENQIYLTKKYRFKNEELNHLEENIFGIPYHIYKNKNESINLYLAENPYNEVEYVASEIVQLVRDKEYRFKDIAVICNNLETYSSLCKAIFLEYDIPVFIDEKKDITQNIIIKYLLSILDIYINNWSFESVFNYLKTDLIDIDNLYELENYCLKWGIKGKKFYDKKWDYDKEGYNYQEEQKRIIEPLLELKEKIEQNKQAFHISECLYYFLENMKKNSFDNINDDDDNDNNKKNNNNIFEIQENIEAWELVINTLKQITILFEDERMTFDHFSKILKTGLSTKELGQIPQTQDKVIVGDVNRSKTHKVKAVFIIGVNDGIFPSVHSSEGFFNDRDREILKGQKFELAKGTKEKMYEENFNIYKAFSTAEEKLFISYASSDSEGKALRKSLIISRLKRIFPNLHEENEYEDKVLTPRITFSKLLNNIDNEEWNEVYVWYDKHYKQKLKNALKGLKYSNLPTKINTQNIEKLYGKNIKTSISKLERYESCPFSYFLKYGLRISEKEKLEIKPIDTGSFMHDVVDRFFKEIREKNIDIKNISNEQYEAIICDIIDEKLQFETKFSLTAKYRNLIKRLKRVLIISIKYIIESLKTVNLKY